MTKSIAAIKEITIDKVDSDFRFKEIAPWALTLLHLTVFFMFIINYYKSTRTEDSKLDGS